MNFRFPAPPPSWNPNLDLLFIFVLFVVYHTTFVNEIRAFYSSNVISIVPQLYCSICLFFPLLVIIQLIYCISSLKYLHNSQSHMLGLICTQTLNHQSAAWEKNACSACWGFIDITHPRLFSLRFLIFEEKLILLDVYWAPQFQCWFPASCTPTYPLLIDYLWNTGSRVFECVPQESGGWYLS